MIITTIVKRELKDNSWNAYITESFFLWFLADNSASYPNSETDSLKSSQSTSSTHTSGHQTLRTFHPDIREVPQPPPLPPSTRSQSKGVDQTFCENCEHCRGDGSDSYQCQSLSRHSMQNGTYSNGLPHPGVHHGSLPQPPGSAFRGIYWQIALLNL